MNPMPPTLLEPVDLRARGFEALVKSLGWVNAVRFIHQFERSRLDYTAERDALLPAWDAAELVKRMAGAADATSRNSQSGHRPPRW